MTVQNYTTIADVKNLSRITPKKLGLEKENTEELNSILNEWILEASSLINDYTSNPLTDTEITEKTTKYYVYKNMATRIVANMCALSSAYKSNGVIKYNDWTISTIPSEIFNTDMKSELDNYKNETTNNSTRFGILTVTGRRDLNEN